MSASASISISRRRFLQTSTALAASASLKGNETAASPLSSPAEIADGWFDRPMRWAQLTLVEDDPGKFDPAFWIDYFKRTHSDAACLSAGGYVAYYPTKIPLHHRSFALRDSDPFGELLAGCRRLNMIVIARTDPHAAHQDVYEAHPDWIAVDAEGRKRRHWATPEAWVTCALGPYNFEFMTQVHREIVTLYKIDGVFSNRWAGSGMCYCEHCRENFHAASGMDLPRTNDPQDPRRRSFLLWQEQRLFDLWKLWDAEIRKITPEARFIANSGGGALSPLDMKTVGDLSSILFADRQARRGLAVPWSNGKNAKEYRATLGRKPIGGIFSVGLEEPYRWKDSVQSEAEIRIWVADGVANGLRPWFTKFSGTLHDRRWLPVVEKIYGWHYRSERYLRNEAPLARVGLVYSQQTGRFYGGARALQKVEDPILGMYQALIEARVPFEMVHDRLLDTEHTSPFKLLILPNVAALSDQQCAQLREFAGRGGSLVATFETSLYDDRGVRRPNFGLSDLFGVSFKAGPQGPMQNSYLKLEKDPTTGKHHAILAGLEDTERIINGVNRVEVSALQTPTYAPLTLIPSYPDLPMEEVYPRVQRTTESQVFLRESGKSRIVYFPWDIDRTFWEVLCVDHGRLLSNAVQWACNEPQQVSVKGLGVLDVTVWRQKESMTVHLVNLTNPMMMKGPIRELIPLGAQHVRIKLAEGKRARKIQFLVSGGAPAARVTNGNVDLTVPSILDHEVIAIDF